MPIPGTWLIQRALGTLLRPATRIVIGLIAIPVLRSVRKRVLKQAEWDDELEKDVEQWFRASLVLFFATKNMETIVSQWLALNFDFSLDHWFIVAGRLLVAIGVVESMPDQQLFSIIHPGPPKLVWRKQRGLQGNVSDQAWPLVRGLLCRHINRTSPVFAILSVIFGGLQGWVFFALAIVQYLVIGLVTSRDKALDVLSEFDRKIAQQREVLIDEFHLRERTAHDLPLVGQVDLALPDETLPNAPLPKPDK